jgi:hypothetical protein
VTAVGEQEQRAPARRSRGGGVGRARRQSTANSHGSAAVLEYRDPTVEPARSGSSLQGRWNVNVDALPYGFRARGTRPPVAVLTAAVAGIALLAACGGGSSKGQAASGPSDKALAFAQCMRSHGVPAFPDPGKPVGNDVDGNSPQFLRASKLCDKLGHNPQGQLTAARQQQLLSQGLKFAMCMRQHGLPGFPDPTAPPGGGISFNVPSNVSQSPQFQTSMKICRSTK